MARARSQQLVIDASVARAAGPEGATHPTAKHCRDFLLATLDVCHRAVFTPAIAEEGGEHQSGFAHQWRLSMFARKKIDRLGGQPDPRLRGQIGEAAAGAKEQDEMQKDVHLVEAALAGSMRVASLDETVRAYFRAAAISVLRLRSVCWVNPDISDEDALAWLKAGAPADDFRTLGHDLGEE
jgi:hypothetical protein